MLTIQQSAAEKQIAAAAVASEKATKLPAPLTAAQCIFESAWLTRCPENNCFGIKPDHHGAGVQYFVSKEFLNGEWETIQEAFEKYATLADCFSDHARLIITGAPYAAAWADFLATGDVDGLILAIGPIYATAPGYARNILAESHAPSLTAAIAAARAA